MFYYIIFHYIIIMYYWKAIIYQSRHSNKEPEHLTSVDATTDSHARRYKHRNEGDGRLQGNKIVALRSFVASWSDEIRSSSNSKLKPKLDKPHK